MHGCMAPKFGAENIQYYIVQYHNKKWKRWQSSKTNNPDPKIILTLDPALRPNKEYNFIIRAVSIAGVSAAIESAIKITKWIQLETH